MAKHTHSTDGACHLALDEHVTHGLRFNLGAWKRKVLLVINDVFFISSQLTKEPCKVLFSKSENH